MPKNLLYEQIYHWTSSIFAILLPILVLVLLTLLINYELFYRRVGIANNTEQKKCVNRLTLATTMCTLLLDMPQVFIFVAAAIWGADELRDNAFKYAIPIANFLRYTVGWVKGVKWWKVCHEIPDFWCTKYRFCLILYFLYSYSNTQSENKGPTRCSTENKARTLIGCWIHHRSALLLVFFLAHLFFPIYVVTSLSFHTIVWFCVVW